MSLGAGETSQWVYAYCSCRGISVQFPELTSDGSQGPVTPATKDLTPPSAFCRHLALMCTYPTQNTYTGN